MRALILNSGMGKRMGDLTNAHPKCMTVLDHNETILSRQLKQLLECGITEVVITTGYFNEVLVKYCNELDLPLQYFFINNPLYETTNYIYSIYLARKELHHDIILLHGDLVFDTEILRGMLRSDNSNMTISSVMPLPLKDFKAVVRDNRVDKIGIDYFENALTAQPLYTILYNDWQIWLNSIIDFCERGHTLCYAEDAFNKVANKCCIKAFDYKDRLCAEIDTPEDLELIKGKMLLV